MIDKLEKILLSIGSVEDVYTFENTCYVTHIKHRLISESDVTSLLNTLDYRGFDVDLLTYGFYSHPIDDTVYGIYLAIK